MRVILDSNVVCADFPMAGTAFRTLLDSLEQTGHTLCVPQLVIDEVISKYSEELARSKQKIDKEVKRITSISGSSVSPPLSEQAADEMTTDYAARLMSRLNGAAATVLDYPTIPHESVVRRALERRKPFSASGAGYRDALIWEAVLAAAEKEDDAISFITQNRRRFLRR